MFSDCYRCERFHRTVQEEFCNVVFRKKIYRTLEDLQPYLDQYVVEYNTQRTHQRKRCQGRTPMQTFPGQPVDRPGKTDRLADGPRGSTVN